MVQPDSSISWSAPTHHPLFFPESFFSHTLFMSHFNTIPFSCASSLCSLCSFLYKRRWPWVSLWQQSGVNAADRGWHNFHYAASNIKHFVCESGIKDGQVIWMREGSKETGEQYLIDMLKIVACVENTYSLALICVWFVCVCCFVAFVQCTVTFGHRIGAGKYFSMYVWIIITSVYVCHGSLHHHHVYVCLQGCSGSSKLWLRIRADGFLLKGCRIQQIIIWCSMSYIHFHV